MPHFHIFPSSRHADTPPAACAGICWNHLLLLIYCQFSMSRLFPRSKTFKPWPVLAFPSELGHTIHRTSPNMLLFWATSYIPLRGSLPCQRYASIVVTDLAEILNDKGLRSYSKVPVAVHVAALNQRVNCAVMCPGNIRLPCIRQQAAKLIEWQAAVHREILRGSRHMHRFKTYSILFTSVKCTMPVRDSDQMVETHGIRISRITMGSHKYAGDTS